MSTILQLMILDQIIKLNRNLSGENVITRWMFHDAEQVDPKEERQRARAEEETKWVSVDGAKIAYRDSGSGTPVVVINSGIRGPHIDLHDELAKHTRVISYDHASMGASESVPRKPLWSQVTSGKGKKGRSTRHGRSVGEVSQELSHLLAALRVPTHDDAVVLVATDINWMATLGVAYRNPDLVGCVVLVNPLVQRYSQPPPSMVDKVFSGYVQSVDDERSSAASSNNVINVAKGLEWLSYANNNAQFMTPSARIEGAPCAASILEEALFIQAVYHPSAHNRCLPLDKICSIPSLTRLLTSYWVRTTNRRAWQALASEVAGTTLEFTKHEYLRSVGTSMFNGGKNITSVQLPAVLAPPDGKKFDLEPATVPPSVPVVAVVSSCDVERVNDALEHHADLTTRFAHTVQTSKGVPEAVPPEPAEIVARLDFIKYAAERNAVLSKFIPHLAFVHTNVAESRQPATSPWEAQRLVVIHAIQSIRAGEPITPPPS